MPGQWLTRAVACAWRGVGVPEGKSVPICTDAGAGLRSVVLSRSACSARGLGAVENAVARKGTVENAVARKACGHDLNVLHFFVRACHRPAKTDRARGLGSTRWAGDLQFSSVSPSHPALGGCLQSEQLFFCVKSLFQLPTSNHALSFFSVDCVARACKSLFQ